MNPTPPGPVTKPHARAAFAVWIAAAGLLLVGGCLSASLAAVALTPAQLLMANPVVAAMPEADRAQLLQLRTAAGPAALGTAALLGLPAAALLGLGLVVRRGHARAAAATRVLCVVVAVLLGAWTVATLAGGVAAVPVALVQTGLVALLWRAGRLLRADRLDAEPGRGAAPGVSAAAGGGRRGLGSGDDPWDALL